MKEQEAEVLRFLPWYVFEVYFFSVIWLFTMDKTKKTIPVKQGEKIDLIVEKLSSRGDGICRYQGYTLFLPDCIPEDRVLAEVVKIAPHYSVCKVLKRISPSSVRIKPLCQVFFECGGCQLQYLPYKKQVDFKIGSLTEALERIGKLKLPNSPLSVPAALPFHYRNRGMFPVGKKRDRLVIGFYARASHNIVNIEDCPVMFKPINQIKEAVRHIIEKYNPPIYNETTHKGFIRNLLIRGSMRDKEFLIGLVTTMGQINKKMVKEMVDINKAVKGKYKIAGIIQNINTVKGNAALGTKSKVLWGRKYFYNTIGKIRYRQSLTAFSQINPYQSERINRIIEEMLSDEKGLILDAYCGTGNIALWLASMKKPVIGIEEHEGAVKDAIINATENKISFCSFIAARVEDYLADTNNKKNFSVAILNPPRKGCSKEMIEELIKRKIKKIIYVSCNPATLARDLSKLCYEGYAMNDVRIIDMFPQTIHMETVVLLQHKLK